MNEEQQMIDRGTAAQEILAMPIFQATYNTLVNTYINTFFQSQVDQEEERKHAFYQMRALQDLLGIMNQWVAVKDNIMASNEEAVEE